VSQPNIWTLFVSWLFVATIYLKRECHRLAEWTGLGNIATVVIAAACAGGMAAAFTFVRGYGGVGTVLLSMVLGFGLTASLLIYIVLLKVPGGAEKYYTVKREELLRLREEYARIVKSELEASRQRISQELAQKRAQYDAQRRAEEESARQQAAQDVAAGLPAGNIHTQTERASELPRQVGTQVVIVTPTKSVGISIILTVLFGPLGMFYSTVAGGLLMLMINLGVFAVGICTFGVGFLGFLLTWPICILWGALAVSSYNEKLTRGTRQY
jgi:hypothetical protein